jgi:Lipid A core - O-antigen ligase and related enzymes
MADFWSYEPKKRKKPKRADQPHCAATPQDAGKLGDEKHDGIQIVVGKRDLVPNWLYSIAFLISFTLPNLVFSGKHFFDTLHLMKWTVTMVPIGLLALVAGVQLLRYGAKRTGFVLDPFGAAWLVLLVLICLQPATTPLTSISTYAKEWFYFASLVAVYILAYNLQKNTAFHRALLWGASLNAAINVVFAEILIRVDIGTKLPSYIMDVRGNYIGNTAQQEMFGLWVGMAVLNAIFLHTYYFARMRDGKPAERTSAIRAICLNLVLLCVNSWGLWNSTARGAILSLFVAFVFMTLCLWRNRDRSGLLAATSLFLVVLVFLGVVLGLSAKAGQGRGGALVSKMRNMIENPTAMGDRISIWHTSWEIYRDHPVTGVGLGHYKWHFLRGQKVMYERNPDLVDNPNYSWQYTYWAHSEYLQWLCETGLIGAAILLGMGLWWLYRFFRALVRGEKLPPEAVWGCAMLFMLWFDALFSRPFHRIENSVWMALAFALANRSLFSPRAQAMKEENDGVYRIFGAILTGTSLFGFVFLAGGIHGDRLMLKALTPHYMPIEQRFANLNAASKYIMSRDDALEQIATLSVHVAAQQKNMDQYVSGIHQLHAAFQKRATAKLLLNLAQYAEFLNLPELRQEVLGYLRPGGLQPRGAIPLQPPVSGQ